MVKIIEKIIPKGQTKQRPGFAMSPKYITVHNTANASKGANAETHARYLLNGGGGRAVGWHFTVDDAEIYQHLPVNESGYHAGDGGGAGNRQSIGIEICENSDGDFEKAVKNAQWLIEKLMREHNIPKANVVPHKKWTGKNCPHKLLGRWDAFIDGIGTKPKAEVIEVKKEVTKTVEKTKTKLPDAVYRARNPYPKGSGVKAVQTALASVYFYPDKGAKNNGIDGYYGPKTADAVRRFQLINRLVANGIYGPKTKAKLEGMI